MEKKDRGNVVLVAILFLLCMPGLLFAQTSSGKLSGKVVDQDTNEPLIGATVSIVGTQLGAATDVNGQYFILNITAGNYEVRIGYIGYQNQIIKDVRVVSGVTKELDIKLKSSVVTMQELVVQAERVFFEAKATNTVKVYDAQEIKSLPVRGVERVVGLQSGVVMAEGSGGVDGNPTVNIRGGRGNEVLYIVDGVAQNDPLFGANYSQVSDDAIQQVSFQLGGYEAKYGQAQSGVVNITTKSGGSAYNFGADVVSSTFTDAYGYNQYNGNLSGPIIPGSEKHTFFFSAERGWFADANPSAIPIEFNSDKVSSSKTLPGNDASVWRYTARTTHDFKDVILRLGANINQRDTRTFTLLYAKANSDHNPRIERMNQSYTARASVPFSNSTFLNVNLGYKRYDDEEGDGVWFDNLEAYGDTAANRSIGVNLLTQGTRMLQDPTGIFNVHGRVFNGYTKVKDETFSLDADYTIQLAKHYIEIGGSADQHTLRYFNVGPIALALDNKTLTEEQRFRKLRAYFFGYDVTGTKETKAGDRDTVGSALKTEPKQPISLSGYVQDRYELQDLVINVGIRFDYFDSKADILKNETLPFASGNTTAFDDKDFKKAKAEFYISPRIGLGFPVTPTTVFHAQLGKFIQQPRLIDLYTSPNSLSSLVNDENLGVNTGGLKSEQTTQYELGFRQILGDNRAALNITAFYKNTKGLVNQSTRVFFRRDGGQQLRYYGPSNTDFGTVRGLGFTLDVARVGYVSMSLNYTYSIAEGTGSSTNSSYVATFRNDNGEIPKVIAPLDFDQRHTGTLNFGFNTGKGELGVFQNVAVNAVASFNSGRPYTPLESQNILAGTTNYGDTRGYINSAYGPGSFLIDLKAEKTFELGHLLVTPYVWVENLLNTVNAVNVYRSTGDPYTGGWLNSDEGKKVVAAQPVPANYAADYQTYERDPANFGIPRTVKLGVRVNYGGLHF